MTSNDQSDAPQRTTLDNQAGASNDALTTGHVNHDLLAHAVRLLNDAQRERTNPVPDIRNLQLPPTIPESGLGPVAALDILATSVLKQSAQLHHIGYFAHMDPPTPDVTVAAALWQNATNQNTLHPDAAPAIRLLEERVVQWLSPFFGMEGGHLVSGSTVANFTALWMARDLRQARRVIASDRAHLSIKKSAHLLGLEFESVPSDASHQLNAIHLTNLEDTAVVLTAGTVATGALDPVAAIQTVPLSQAAWCHVDAAWAGPLRLSDRHGTLLDGIEFADSVCFSAHKWLYQPKGCAVVLFRDYTEALAPLSYGGGYLASPNIGLSGSAPASALPLAATLMALGRDGLATSIENDMERAKTLANLIDSDSQFELWGPPVCGVVVFRAVDVESRVLRSNLCDAWLSLVDLDGEVWLRAVAANPNADALHVYGRVAAALSASK